MKDQKKYSAKTKSTKSGSAAPFRGSKKKVEKKVVVEELPIKRKTEPAKKAIKVEPLAPPENMRLNRYIAHAGIAARRKADIIIASGEVTVNGVVIKEMGHRVEPNDVVKYKGKVVIPSRNFVYILLNKPRNYITTVSDEKDRNSVMALVASATTERVYPVGRLDRNTTGLLLITNDGLLAQKLSHPSYEVQKIYHTELDKPLTEAHFEQLKQGVLLDDGFAKVNDIGYPDAGDRRMVGVEIHIGKNRIVRRLFEHLGYQVEKLDRVMYAGLTKKDLPRGKWRKLSPMEIMQLKKK